MSHVCVVRARVRPRGHSVWLEHLPLPLASLMADPLWRDYTRSRSEALRPGSYSRVVLHWRRRWQPGSGQDTPCHAIKFVDSMAIPDWQEEFTLLRQITPHPNIVKALRVYEPQPASDRLEGVLVFEPYDSDLHAFQKRRPGGMVTVAMVLAERMCWHMMHT